MTLLSDEGYLKWQKVTRKESKLLSKLVWDNLQQNKILPVDESKSFADSIESYDATLKRVTTSVVETLLQQSQIHKSKTPNLFKYVKELMILELMLKSQYTQQTKLIYEFTKLKTLMEDDEFRYPDSAEPHRIFKFERVINVLSDEGKKLMRSPEYYAAWYNEILNTMRVQEHANVCLNTANNIHKTLTKLFDDYLRTGKDIADYEDLEDDEDGLFNQMKMLYGGVNTTDDATLNLGWKVHELEETLFESILPQLVSQEDLPVYLKVFRSSNLVDEERLDDDELIWNMTIKIANEIMKNKGIKKEWVKKEEIQQLLWQTDAPASVAFNQISWIFVCTFFVVFNIVTYCSSKNKDTKNQAILFGAVWLIDFFRALAQLGVDDYNLNNTGFLQYASVVDMAFSAIMDVNDNGFFKYFKKMKNENAAKSVYFFGGERLQKMKILSEVELSEVAVLFNAGPFLMNDGLAANSLSSLVDEARKAAGPIINQNGTMQNVQTIAKLASVAFWRNPLQFWNRLWISFAQQFWLEKEIGYSATAVSVASAFFSAVGGGFNVVKAGIRYLYKKPENFLDEKSWQKIFDLRTYVQNLFIDEQVPVKFMYEQKDITTTEGQGKITTILNKLAKWGIIARDFIEPSVLDSLLLVVSGGIELLSVNRDIAATMFYNITSARRSFNYLANEAKVTEIFFVLCLLQYWLQPGVVSLAILLKIMSYWLKRDSANYKLLSDLMNKMLNQKIDISDVNQQQRVNVQKALLNGINTNSLLTNVEITSKFLREQELPIALVKSWKVTFDDQNERSVLRRDIDRLLNQRKPTIAPLEEDYTLGRSIDLNDIYNSTQQKGIWSRKEIIETIHKGFWMNFQENTDNSTFKYAKNASSGFEIHIKSTNTNYNSLFYNETKTAQQRHDIICADPKELTNEFQKLYWNHVLTFNFTETQRSKYPPDLVDTTEFSFADILPIENLIDTKDTLVKWCMRCLRIVPKTRVTLIYKKPTAADILETRYANSFSNENSKGKIVGDLNSNIFGDTQKSYEFNQLILLAERSQTISNDLKKNTVQRRDKPTTKITEWIIEPEADIRMVSVLSTLVSSFILEQLAIENVELKLPYIQQWTSELSNVLGVDFDTLKWRIFLHRSIIFPYILKTNPKASGVDMVLYAVKVTKAPKNTN